MTSTRREIVRYGSGALLSSLCHKRASAQIMVAPAYSNSQANYVAQQLGMAIHFNMKTFNPFSDDSSQPPINNFNPTTANFVPSWIAAAQAMKAKYVILTTKHNDGFCIWPTLSKAYNIANTTWYANNGNLDIVQAFVTAVQAAGLKFGFYFQAAGDSLALCEAQLTELMAYGSAECIWVDTAGTSAPAPWASAVARKSYINGLTHNPLAIINIHKNDPGFNLSNTDILEYEGPSEKPPVGNGVPSEMIEVQWSGTSLHEGHNLPGWFYYELLTGTNATAGTSNTITIPGGSGVNNYYQGMDVEIKSGTGAGQRLTVQSYNGSTGVFTMTTNWSPIPDTTSVVTVHPQLRSLADLVSEYNNCIANDATYLLNTGPDTSGHVPADQLSLFTSFGATH